MLCTAHAGCKASDRVCIASVSKEMALDSEQLQNRLNADLI